MAACSSISSDILRPNHWLRHAFSLVQIIDQSRLVLSDLLFKFFHSSYGSYGLPRRLVLLPARSILSTVSTTFSSLSYRIHVQYLHDTLVVLCTKLGALRTGTIWTGPGMKSQQRKLLLLQITMYTDGCLAFYLPRACL